MLALLLLGAPARAQEQPQEQPPAPPPKKPPVEFKINRIKFEGVKVIRTARGARLERGGGAAQRGADREMMAVGIG